MKEIPLTQGLFAIVDDEDYGCVMQYNWYAHYNKNTKTFYAERTDTVSGKSRVVPMHRYLLGAHKSESVDHENHDTLDNRRENIRITNHTGNGRNVRLSPRNKSGFCGVWWNKKTWRWHAAVIIKGKNVHLGTFIEKRDAIKARQAANLKYGFHPNHGKAVDLLHNPTITITSATKNRRLACNNTTGVNGVFWSKTAKKWHVKSYVNGKQIHIGYYANIEDAIAARKAADIKYGFHENHGRAVLNVSPRVSA